MQKGFLFKMGIATLYSLTLHVNENGKSEFISKHQKFCARKRLWTMIKSRTFTERRYCPNDVIAGWTGALFKISVMAFLIMALCNCSNDKASEPVALANVEGFTFFDLGSNSQLSDQVRNHLENRLGSEAIAQRSTIDLSIHFPEFLKTYFPNLDQLNNKLNWPPRERVEHNITKLMYRYVNSKKLPFDYVELFFSNYTGKPLFFRIRAGIKGASTIDILKEKYGSYQQIQWPKNEGQTLFWKDKKDILTASSTLDRYDRPEYLFCIFYAANLEKLVKKEEIEQTAREDKIKNAGEEAF